MIGQSLKWPSSEGQKTYDKEAPRGQLAIDLPPQVTTAVERHCKYSGGVSDG